MSMINWAPTRELISLHETMNRLMEGSQTRSVPGYTRAEREAILPVDVYSTSDEIVVIAAIPGLTAEDVQITYEADVLTIRGRFPERLENTDYVMAERYHGAFIRMLQLNIPIDADRIEATCENGLLRLVLPKAEAVKPRVIKVQTRKS